MKRHRPFRHPGDTEFLFNQETGEYESVMQTREAALPSLRDHVKYFARYVVVGLTILIIGIALHWYLGMP